VRRRAQPRPPHPRRQEAVAMVAAGLPQQVVARTVDVTLSALQRWCAAAGVRSAWRFPMTEAERAALRRLRESGALPP